jgi:uncharacterized protein YwgA/phosphotransferase system HPr-like phosphotransfer protein
MRVAFDLHQAARRFCSDATLESGQESVSLDDPAALVVFPAAGRVSLRVEGRDEALAMTALGRVLRAGAAPIDEVARFFRLMHDLELVTDEEKSRAWVGVRRRLAEPERKRLLERLRRFEAGPGCARVCDRKDLLTLLLYARGPHNQPAEPISGLTRIQKLLFIAMKELGAGRLVARPYAFVPYRYGPFSAEVYDDLDMLATAGLVRHEELDEDGTPTLRPELEVAEGVRDESLTRRFRLSRRGRKFAAALLVDVEKRYPTLARGLAAIKARWGTGQTDDLMAYVYAHYPRYTTESLVRDQILPSQPEKE